MCGCECVGGWGCLGEWVGHKVCLLCECVPTEVSAEGGGVVGVIAFRWQVCVAATSEGGGGGLKLCAYGGNDCACFSKRMPLSV